jgi:hypothetical protein
VRAGSQMSKRWAARSFHLRVTICRVYGNAVSGPFIAADADRWPGARACGPRGSAPLRTLPARRLRRPMSAASPTNCCDAPRRETETLVPRFGRRGRRKVVHCTAGRVANLQQPKCWHCSGRVFSLPPDSATG